MVNRASDPTSLFKMQEYVSRLSIDQLKNEIQNNTGSVPSWMLISALQDKLRANASGMQAQKPSSTVASDLIRKTSEPQQVGIGSLVPREEAPEPQVMAHGGIVKMADGEEVVDQYPLDPELSGLPKWQVDRILAERNAAQAESRMRVGPPSNVPADVTAHFNREFTGGARSGPQPSNYEPWLMPYANQPSPGAIQTDSTLPVPPIPPGASPPSSPGRMPSPGVSGAGAISGGLGSSGGRGAGIAGISTAGASGAQPDVFGNMRSAFAAERKAVDDLLDMAKSERESSKEQKENAKWEAMLHAGLNIMAAGAKTGNALGAIGAGAAAGAQQFSSNLKDIRKDQREKILDELKARQLKLDSLAKEGVIDYHQLHEQNAMALGQARLQAASAASSSRTRDNIPQYLAQYNRAKHDIVGMYSPLLKETYDPKAKAELIDKMRREIDAVDETYAPYLPHLQFPISNAPRNPAREG